jgi:hypothetical protein
MQAAFDGCPGYVNRRSQNSLVCRPAGTSGLSMVSRIAGFWSSSYSELLKRAADRPRTRGTFSPFGAGGSCRS